MNNYTFSVLYIVTVKAKNEDDAFDQIPESVDVTNYEDAELLGTETIVE